MSDKTYQPYSLPYSPAGATKDQTKLFQLWEKFNTYLAQFKKIEKKYSEAKNEYESFVDSASLRITAQKQYVDTNVATIWVLQDAYYAEDLYVGEQIFITGVSKPYFGNHEILSVGDIVDTFYKQLSFTVSHANLSIENSKATIFLASDAYTANNRYKKFIDAKKAWQDKSKQLDALKKLIDGKTTPTSSVDSAPGDNTGLITAPDDTAPVKMNLPGIKELYFTENSSYTDNVLFTTSGNRPSVEIDRASKLWKSASQNGKGMIQTYVMPIATDTNGKPANPELYTVRDINKSRYGFRFIYNPGTISMTYAGTPAVDVGLEVSGRDKIPLIGSAASSSTLTFNLLINRMNDMKYLHSLNSKEDSFQRGTFTAQPDFKDLYGVAPSTEELMQIRDRGTMYDIEFLLRTLIGYALPSQLRNFTTADIGYLGAYPVELHLGKSLRYLVTINSFDLEHTIFTKDMVPVFTNMRITCNRLPDFPYNAGTKSALESYYGTNTSGNASQDSKDKAGGN
jgi:hypothetical protein